MRLRTHPATGRPAGPPRPWLFLAAFCLLAGCGMIGAGEDQSKGDRDLPLSGVGPFAKQFTDCSSDSPDPIFMTSDRDDVFWGEPWLLQESDARFMLFFEERTQAGTAERLDIRMQRVAIVPAAADSCRTWDLRFVSPQGNLVEDPDPVLVLQGGGAPCVLAGAGGVFRIWYGLENESGIDYVEMREEAGGRFAALRPAEPVLRPSEAWERGTVGSPSVLSHPVSGELQLWYEGSVLSGRSIGYAAFDAAAGRWVKRDAAGRTSADHPGEVRPVLWPSQVDWEYHYPAELDSGSVGTPHVILFQSPARTYYYMYYTGNLTGRPSLNPLAHRLAHVAPCLKERAPLDGAEGCLTEQDKALLAALDDQDTSIGLAGSLDGVTWLKSSTVQDWGEVAWQVNPILNEVFAIDALNKLWVMIQGEAYEEKIQGSTNVFFPLVIVDEMAPSTLNLKTRFFMVYQQAGGLSFRKGLALATVER